ncbi:MAG: hypothetical protein Q9198_003670 [Flavoplaca austrocitrina]
MALGSETSPSAAETSVERYIEAWPGVDFQIEVYFSRDFKSELGIGITVGIKLDGGATHGYHLTKAQINRYQMSGSPIVFEGIEKSSTERVAIRFGPMNENIDWALGDPDSHIPDFGTIEVEVVRIKLKGNVLQPEQSPSAAATTPRKVVDLSGQKITEYMYTGKDFKILAEKVDRLEEQLKEWQQQTAALMEKLVGGIHSTIQTALERRPTGSVSTPAHYSGVKRKRNTDEITPVVEKRPIDPSSRNYYGD